LENLIIDNESFSLSQWDFLIRLLVATGIGAVIGLERQYNAMKENSHGYSGIRTFIFHSIFGFIAGIFYFLLSPWIYAVLFLGLVVLTTVSYWQTALQGDLGMTTELSSLLTFLLGSMAVYGLIEISLMLTVILVVILSSKFQLKAMVGKITADELYAFIRFVVLALLIFPFLPDQTFGPYAVLNPKEIGWVVLLTSGLGFFGYMLIKFIGENKGILLSGILGGLVSSTAVTWVFAQKSKENPNLSASCATAILAASSIMFIRVLVWSFLFNNILFQSLFLTFSTIFLTTLGVTLYTFSLQKKEINSSNELPLKKPLDLKSALVFGALYMAILLAVSYANENLGDSGILISSGIAGISDIDAITISLAKLTGNPLSINLAGTAILIASISNTLVKLGIGFYAGGQPLRKHLIRGYGAGIIAGLLVMGFRFLI
jgi:uncharacterized membrane protein (DUF4010 family)